jgi:hypothetical protein
VSGPQYSSVLTGIFRWEYGVEAAASTSESESVASGAGADGGAQSLPKLDVAKLSRFFTALTKAASNVSVTQRIDHYVSQERVLSIFTEVANQLRAGGAGAADAAVRARQLAGKFRALAKVCDDALEYGEIDDPRVTTLVRNVQGLMNKCAERLSTVEVPFDIQHDPWAQSGVEVSNETLPPWVQGSGYRIVDVTALKQLLARAGERRHALFDDIARVLGEWSSCVQGLGLLELVPDSTMARHRRAIDQLHTNISSYLNEVSGPVGSVLQEVRFGCRCLLDRFSEYHLHQSDVGDNDGEAMEQDHSWPSWVEPGASEDELPRIMLNAARLDLSTFVERLSEAARRRVAAPDIVHLLTEYESIAGAVNSGMDGQLESSFEAFISVARGMDNRADQLGSLTLRRFQYAEFDRAKFGQLRDLLIGLAERIRDLRPIAYDDPYEGLSPAPANSPQWMTYRYPPDATFDVDERMLTPCWRVWTNRSARICIICKRCSTA